MRDPVTRRSDVWDSRRRRGRCSRALPRAAAATASRLASIALRPGDLRQAARRRDHVAGEEHAVAAVDRRSVAPGLAGQVQRAGAPVHHLAPAPGLALAPAGERGVEQPLEPRRDACSADSPGRIGICAWISSSPSGASELSAAV